MSAWRTRFATSDGPSCPAPGCRPGRRQRPAAHRRDDAAPPRITRGCGPAPESICWRGTLASGRPVLTSPLRLPRGSAGTAYGLSEVAPETWSEAPESRRPHERGARIGRRFFDGRTRHLAHLLGRRPRGRQDLRDARRGSSPPGARHRRGRSGSSRLTAASTPRNGSVTCP